MRSCALAFFEIEQTELDKLAHHFVEGNFPLNSQRAHCGEGFIIEANDDAQLTPMAIASAGLRLGVWFGSLAHDAPPIACKTSRAPRTMTMPAQNAHEMRRLVIAARVISALRSGARRPR